MNSRDAALLASYYRDQRRQRRENPKDNEDGYETMDPSGAARGKNGS